MKISEIIKESREDNFKRWFENSKVVDGSGKPLVVYHGTGADFSNFGLGRGAIYFTDDSSVASVYADHAEVDGSESAPNVLAVYLRIKNPLVIDEAWAKENLDDEDGDRDWTILDNVVYNSVKTGHDGVILRSVEDFAGMDANGKRMIRPYDQFIVFSPRQIKSATGNNGNFDPNNPDITKE
jgi:hypothetical protein